MINRFRRRRQLCLTLSILSRSHARSPSTVLDTRCFDTVKQPLHYDHELESTIERLRAMITKSAMYFDDCSNYLTEPKHSYLKMWRQRMLEWYFEVIDHMQHDRALAALAINFLDRYTAAVGEEHLSQRRYLLAALTCLYLSSKLYTTRVTRCCHLSIEFLIRGCSRGVFLKVDVEQMEVEVLTTLHWFFHPPIVPEFIEELFHLLPRWLDDRDIRQRVFEHARYSAELALLSCQFTHSPSTLAYGCILSALNKVMPLHVRNSFVRNVASAIDVTPDMVEDESRCVEQLMRLSLA